jgi:hypothetical protein
MASSSSLAFCWPSVRPEGTFALAKNVVAKSKYRAQDFFYHFVSFRHGETAFGISGEQIRAVSVATCRFL